MPVQQLVIAPVARDDLKNIYHYGRRQWGKARSDSYMAILQEQFWSLTEQPLISIERPELLPEVSSLAIQSHTVFYRVAAKRIEIIRVLHGRQDPQRQLK
ncbi:MAG: type II toxin-antitoxin system RelE/ParE family toxin [Gammaproteobacteria bacterium]|jgi:toxin ParE1/3/4|nr:type II toxin-antitoxin system RelE/ParE family toxin [Gammaproteobacteria bacterium]